LHPIKEDPLVAESSFSFSRQRKIETAFKKSDAISKLKFCGFGTEMKKDGAFNNKNCRPLMEEAVSISNSKHISWELPMMPCFKCPWVLLFDLFQRHPGLQTAFRSFTRRPPSRTISRRIITTTIMEMLQLEVEMVREMILGMERGESKNKRVKGKAQCCDSQVNVVLCRNGIGQCRYLNNCRASAIGRPRRANVWPLLPGIFRCLDWFGLM
jgi:hypothetical protein